MTAAAAAPNPLRAGVVIPFILVALIWGSTWLVIKSQLGTVPPAWSTAWRFILAAAGMLLLARARGESLRLPPGGHLLAAVAGLLQFSLNFQFVYRSEYYLTSGLVAVLFALMIVPNAVLARQFLGTRIGARFIAGSAVALAGIALLLLHEYRGAPVGGTAVLIGTAMVFTALMCASAGNVLFATQRAKAIPNVPLIAWAMVWASLANLIIARVTSGPPQIELTPAYLGGVAYLAIVGSVVTFPLYFGLVRELGPGKAAYNGVVVPIVAMGLSTLFEGYRWTALAAAGGALAAAGLVIALGGRGPGKAG